MAVLMFVNGVRGEKMTITVCEHEKDLEKVTVLELKQKIARSFPAYSESDMQLNFGGERIEGDEKPLIAYGLMHRSTIQMVLTLLGGGHSAERRQSMDSPPHV